MESNRCQANLKRIRVLVVDDDVNSYDFLLIALNSYGIEVYTVRCVHDALKTFIELRPDVLISDLAMLYEDEYLLIRQVKQFEVQQDM